MSSKLIVALLLIAALILVISLNSGTVSINLIFAKLNSPKALLLFITFATGLITGILLKGK